MAQPSRKYVELHNQLVGLLDVLDDICEALVRAKVLAVDPPLHEPRSDLPRGVLPLAKEAYKTAMHIHNRLKK